jgi:PTS system nitrogen regulatory IIA component
MMILDLPIEAIIAELSAKTRDEVLAELSANIVSRLPGISFNVILEALKEREMLGSTGIGDGIAIPHAKLECIANDPLLVFGRSRKGVDFNSLDDRTAHFFFLLISSDADVGAHLQTLARISRILKDQETRSDLLKASDAGSIHRIIHKNRERRI